MVNMYMNTLAATVSGHASINPTYVILLLVGIIIGFIIRGKLG
jgi:hypothetical protein